MIKLKERGHIKGMGKGVSMGGVCCELSLYEQWDQRQTLRLVPLTVTSNMLFVTVTALREAVAPGARRT